MTGRDRDPQSFFSDGDGGIVDGLDVDVVLGEELVRG
jgi:hypothetical protein